MSQPPPTPLQLAWQKALENLEYVDKLNPDDRDHDDCGYTECEQCGTHLAIINSDSPDLCPSCEAEPCNAP